VKKSPAKRIGEVKDNFQEKLEYYLSLNFPYTVEESENEGKKIYVFSYPDLPGCWSEGETLEEAHQRLEEAKEAWIWASLSEGLPIPEPPKEEEFSGKFLLRIPSKLHMQLSKAAEKAGLSLNQYIRSALEDKASIRFLMGKVMEIEKMLLAFQPCIEEVKGLPKRMESLEACFNGFSDLVRQSSAIDYNVTLPQTDAVAIGYWYGPSHLYQLDSRIDLKDEKEGLEVA
jgi:antitoxin HicB